MQHMLQIIRHSTVNLISFLSCFLKSVLQTSIIGFMFSRHLARARFLTNSWYRFRKIMLYEENVRKCGE